VPALPALQQRVIELRAGLRGRAPRTRAQVARKLYRSWDGVARLERRAMRNLRACAASPSPGAAAGPPDFPTAAAAAPPPLITAAASGGDGAPLIDRVKGVSDGVPDGEGGVKGATATGGSPFSRVAASPTAGLEVFLPMAAAMAGLIAFAVWRVRRRGPLEGL
jgi:hypothetical protein